MKNDQIPLIFTVVSYSNNNNDYNMGISYDSFHEINYYETKEDVISTLIDIELDNELLDRDEPEREVTLLINGVDPTEYIFNPEQEEYEKYLNDIYFNIMDKVSLEREKIKKMREQKKEEERLLKIKRDEERKLYEKEMKEKERKELYLSLKKEFENK